MTRTRNMKLWFIVICTCLLCAALVVAAAHTVRHRRDVANAAPAQIPSVRGPMQKIRFTVYDSGIFPPLQRAEPGNVAISLEDRTHRSAGLMVQRELDGLIVNIGLVTPVFNRLRGSTVFSLGTGSYVVFDASEPTNRAELIVEP